MGLAVTVAICGIMEPVSMLHQLYSNLLQFLCVDLMSALLNCSVLLGC